jgi:hypothetical protein
MVQRTKNQAKNKNYFKIILVSVIVLSVAGFLWNKYKEPEVKDMMCQILAVDQDNMVVAGKCMFR